MEVQVDIKLSGQPEIELGDVIVTNTDAYLIIKDTDGYVARNFRGYTGLFGKFDSLQKLSDAFYSKKSNGVLPQAVLYKHTEFDLKLVNKA